MSNRMEVERLIGELHGARVRGDLAGMCRTFREDGQFRIAGASDGKPISIVAPSLREFRQWLTVLVKAFRITDYTLVSLLIEGQHASAHWHARIQSKITGVTVATEFVDLFELADGAIARYTEFFVPR
jgi:ketosteroid isomerase-like protein